MSEVFSLLVKKDYLTDEQILNWCLLEKEANYIPDFVLRNFVLILKTNKKDEFMKQFDKLSLKNENLDLCELTRRSDYGKNKNTFIDNAIA